MFAGAEYEYPLVSTAVVFTTATPEKLLGYANE
jgi:hypothetical protein